jgi:universal stress protein E
MKSYRNILVILNAEGYNRQALEKALFLAKFDKDVKVTVFLSVFDFSLELTSFFDFAEREKMLQAIIDAKNKDLDQAIKDQNIENPNIATKVVWARNQVKAIEREIKIHNYDLIIKAANMEDDTIASFFFTPLDWQLLRKVDIPVILVKDQEWQPDNVLLLALCSINQKITNRVNTMLLREAQIVSKLTNSTIHLVNAVPCPNMNIAIDVPGVYPDYYNEEIHKRHEEQLREFAQNHNIPLENVHVIDGLPDDVIPSLAKTLNVNAVMMGSIGRDGFTGTIVGNTAELIIDEVNCDLIVLKTPIIFD